MARNPGIPHYQRLLSQLLASLQTGAIEQLPSERALARRHGVARGTARRALEELKALGYAQSIPGSGTYPLQRRGRRIALFGYGLKQFYSRFTKPLARRLETSGCHLAPYETGIYGEHLGSTASILEFLSQCDALIWYVSSHYEGRQAAARIRRHLPTRLPMILIGDPIGLALHGTHRFDLLHFDNALAAKHLVELFAQQGIAHPVLIRRGDVRLFSTDETYRGFLSGLVDHGVPHPQQHFLDWPGSGPCQLGAWLARRRSWRPDAVVIGFDYRTAFLHACKAHGQPFPAGLPLYAFGDEPIGRFRMARDYELLAETCSDLILSRLERPSRPNTHTTVAIPVRGMRGVSQT